MQKLHMNADKQQSSVTSGAFTYLWKQETIMVVSATGGKQKGKYAKSKNTNHETNCLWKVNANK